MTILESGEMMALLHNGEFGNKQIDRVESAGLDSPNPILPQLVFSCIVRFMYFLNSL